MSFDEFMKKKEQKQDSFDMIAEKLLKAFLVAFRIENKRYYTNTIKRAQTLSKGEIYQQYGHNTDLYDFLTNFMYKTETEIEQRVNEKVATNSEYVSSAFKKKLKKLLSEHTTSNVIDVSINNHSAINNCAVVNFILENDDQLMLTLNVNTYRNEKGRLYLKHIT